eukprot:COSAG05_NODE_16463_length_345_cov_1.256098_1_plen_80_part_10
MNTVRLGGLLGCVLCAGDHICEAGDAGRELLILIKGNARQAGGQKNDTLYEPGCVWGERQFLGLALRHDHSIIADVYCEV